MKKLISIVTIGLILISGISVFAETTENLVPVFISEEEAKEGYEIIKGFIISYKDQTLTLEVEGKDYPVTVYDKDNTFTEELKYTKEKDFIELVAEYSEATFLLSEIKFISPIMDGVSMDKSKTIEVFYNDEKVELDVNAQVVDKITMIPLSEVLKQMGYNVVWKSETSTVEISKGAQWTSIKIGENAYFKNKMAARPLSAAPVIVEGRTLVPVEFFTTILDRAIQVEDGNLKFIEDQMAIHSGYVKDMRYDETGTMTITLVSDMTSEDMMDQIIIHTSNAYTYYNKEVIIGEFINVICPPIMTMSIPAQTSGVVIY